MPISRGDFAKFGGYGCCWMMHFGIRSKAELLRGYFNDSCLLHRFGDLARHSQPTTAQDSIIRKGFVYFLIESLCG
jgi:hypothetical protein